MTITEKEPTLISSVRRAIHLLETVAEHGDGITAKQLARETGLAIGTTYHLLRTLLHEGYLHKRDDHTYVLGEALAQLRGQVAPRVGLERIRPALSALRDELGMAAYLARYENGEIRVLDVVDSPTAPRVHGPVDLAEAGHASALGKCVLRQLDEDSRRDYVTRHQLWDFTPHTVTHPGELQRLLTQGPSVLVSWDEQEYELGTGCAAVPITDGKTIGALAVSYSVYRRQRVEACTDRLASFARLVSYTLSA